MIMKANKQIGFININEESIDKILKDGDVIFERGFLREKTSTTLPITFDGVGKDLKDYRVYGNTVQSKLPSGYTQVDYIESSETGSYINTNYYPTSDTTIELDYKFVRTTSSSTAIPILGERPTYEGNFKFAIWVNPSSNRTALNFGNYDSGYVANSNPKVRNVITTGNSKLYYNGNLVASSAERTFSRSSLSIYLFGLNERGSILHRNQDTQLYSLKIYENNSLVRNFIPCYRNSDNEVGLYDLVNNVFYTNQGTGTFTYGSVAPTPDTPIEMVSCGDRTKNLFDKNAVSNGYIEANATVGNSPQQYRTSDFIRIKPNTMYYKSFTDSPRTKYFDNNKQVLNTTTHQDISIGGHAGTFTTPNNAYYVRFSYPITVDVNTIQITQSSTTTTYEPYGYKIPVNVNNVITNIYLDEPLRKSDDGTYVDHIDFQNKKVYRQIKEITLNGTEAWSRVSAKNSHYRFRVNCSDLKFGAECVLYCTHFKNNGDSYSFEGISGSTGHVLYIRWDELFETVDDLKTWLASNTPTVDYVLETPTEETITLPNIPTVDGNNTLNIETEITPSKVYIKYKSNN